MPLPSEWDPRLALALLHEIEILGGSAEPKWIYPRLRQYFPRITDSDLAQQRASGGSKWQNIVQFARQHLVDSGFIDRSARGLWVLTDAGRACLAANWQGPGADYSQVKLPRKKYPRPPQKGRNKPGGQKTTGSTVAIHGQPSGTAATTVPVVAAIQPVTGPGILSATPGVGVTPHALCQRLTASQRLSTVPQQFEQSVAEAFVFLGFEAKHLGGSGDTDVFVVAPLGTATYKVVVDAKSTQSGRVAESQISWPVIDSHRKTRGAAFAVVVGEDFSGGQLQTFADQYKVVLLTTHNLCELLSLHSETPLGLQELKTLFETPGRADAAVRVLHERHYDYVRRWRMLADIIDTIADYEQRLPFGYTPRVDVLHMALTIQAFHSGQPGIAAPTQEEVTDAVGLLANRTVGILVDVPGSGGAYRLAMSPDTARKRLEGLAGTVVRHGGSTPVPSVASQTAGAP